jgi:uncharacterized protein
MSYYLLFLLPGVLIGVWAQAKLWSAYNRYRRAGLAAGWSGAEAAREILDQAGLVNVPVQEVGGQLTDHYDPTRRALFLSSENYHGRSVAAVGVAAHEAGHALQHQAAYAPLDLRMKLVPVTQFSSVACFAIVFLGLALQLPIFLKFMWLAVALFAVTTVFQLVTLPVEFDASRRAKAQLLRLGLVQRHEAEGVSAVLSAAALTYVAALVASILQLLYYITLARHSRD